MSLLTDTHHRQVRISYGDAVADVDEGLAETILALWACGFETQYSCEGQGYMRTDDTGGGAYEAPYIVFAKTYPLAMEMEIEEILIHKGWVVLDTYAWESPAEDVPTRTLARFIKPGTTI